MKLNPHWIFPIGFVVVEISVVIFINSASSGGHNLYNTCTANFITEAMKLGIAMYAVISSNLWDDLMKVNRATVVAFGASNLMYAFNNNLMHYSLGALPPAIFIVAINALQTILTSIFQYLVSGKSLLPRQIVACVLLVLSFLASSHGDIIMVLSSGNFSGSQLALLLFLGGLYSIISVTASLTQEKLLKDAPQIMISNVINCSYGVVMQSIGVAYLKVANGYPVFRGFNVWWVWLIPLLFGLSGISISFILKYFDNIIKLICSCVIVLVVHTVSAYMKNENMLDLSFMICWLLTIAAVYLYNRKPEAENENINFKESFHIISSIKNFRNNMKPAYVLIIIILISFGFYMSKSGYPLIFFTIQWLKSFVPTPPADFILNLPKDGSCTFCEAPESDYYSNMNYVTEEFTSNANHTKFSYIDSTTGLLMVQCPTHHKLYRLLPDMNCPNGRSHCFNKWEIIDRHKAFGSVYEFQPIQWSYVLEYSSYNIGNISLPYVWLWCDYYKSVNLVVRPTFLKDRLKHQNVLDGHSSLSYSQQNEVDSYIKLLSEPLPSFKNASESIDTILVVYIDAVSRRKFNKFYKKSLSILQSMSFENSGTSHIAAPLTKLHALNYYSTPNYLAFTSGVSHKNSHEEYFKEKIEQAKISNTFKREPWIFDIAESLGFNTLSGYNACHEMCNESCIEKFKSSAAIESGGYIKQYMLDTSDRPPAIHNWPSEVQCEATFRPEIIKKIYPSGIWPDVYNQTKFHIHHYNEYWMFSMASLFNWTLEWLSASKHSNHNSLKSRAPKRFGTLVIEDAHKKNFNQRQDNELSAFLETVMTSSTDKYNMKNSAILLLADHGMHFTEEFLYGTGKVSNKLPFGYILLPKKYLESRPEYARNLMHNSKQLITAYDLRATVLNMITEREWSASILKPKSNDVIKLKEKIFSSNHGNSILSTFIPFNRTCSDAGIASWFCGCDLLPCDSQTRDKLVYESLHVITRYLNNRVFNEKDLKWAERVCTFFQPKDIILRSQLFDCMSTSKLENGEYERNIIATFGITKGLSWSKKEPIWVTVNMKLRSKSQSDFNPNDIEIVFANSASVWRSSWNRCVNKMIAKNISLPENKQQFCYCF